MRFCCVGKNGVKYVQDQNVFFFSFYSGVIRSFLGVGYEYAAEMTYPLPESISAGLVNAMAMVCHTNVCATIAIITVATSWILLILSS